MLKAIIGGACYIIDCNVFVQKSYKDLQSGFNLSYGEAGAGQTRLDWRAHTCHARCGKTSRCLSSEILSNAKDDNEGGVATRIGTCPPV